MHRLIRLLRRSTNGAVYGRGPRGMLAGLIASLISRARVQVQNAVKELRKLEARLWNLREQIAAIQDRPAPDVAFSIDERFFRWLRSTWRLNVICDGGITAAVFLILSMLLDCPPWQRLPRQESRAEASSGSLVDIAKLLSVASGTLIAYTAVAFSFGGVSKRRLQAMKHEFNRECAAHSREIQARAGAAEPNVIV